MSRTVTARGRARLALAVLVGCLVAVLLPSLATATTGEASTAVVLTAVAMAVATLVAFDRRVAATATQALGPPPCPDHELPLLLGGRATDPVHHPLRPRAPGLA